MPEKVINILNDERGINTPNYVPTQEEAKFILDNYRAFLECKNIKDSAQDVLGGRTLQEFWDRSNWDYNVLTEESEPDDPVKQYSSSMSRDKSNAFIYNLTSQLLYPSVIAQNASQEIDNVISKIARSLLEWSYDNDGYPSENGHQKMVRYEHKRVIEGTTHIQDDIVDGQLISQLVPNEEIYIPNFFQPDIQLQPYMFRVKDNILYEEAEEIFGDLPAWQFVRKGSIDSWGNEVSNTFKDKYQGMVHKDRVQIIYIWRSIAKKDFKLYKIDSKVKRVKLFNVLINGVLMFKVKNLLPYKDGFYPITKGIFEHFSNPLYYWGNSMPNKAMNDKNFLDGWKTLLRYKGKLGAIPPVITFNGQFLPSDIFIPGMTHQAPAGMKPDDIGTLPELTKGITQSDLAILQDAKNEINEGNLSAQATGGEGKQQTYGEALIRERNEQRILGAYGLQMAFTIQARVFPILSRLFQYLSRGTVEKISISSQDLGGGVTGNLDIVFSKDIKNYTEQQSLEFSNELLKKEKVSMQAGKPNKFQYINPSYLAELNLYVKQVADPKPKQTSSLREAKAMEKYNIYRSDPLINQKANTRRFIKEMGDDETDLLLEQPTMPNQGEMGQGGQLTGMVNKASRQPNAPSEELNM